MNIHIPAYYLFNLLAFIVVEVIFSIPDLRGKSAMIMYYNDGWSRYWEAYDGGKRIPVFIANYNSKAVFLQKGDHTVRFVFNPVHYKIGLVAYYIGLLSSTWLIIVLWFKSRKTQSLIL